MMYAQHKRGRGRGLEGHRFARNGGRGNNN